MTVWQSQQAWHTHRMASSCLLSGHTQTSQLSPWHQTQRAVLPVRLFGFWVALAKSGCSFSGLHLSEGKAWWFCAPECQGRARTCCCALMAKQRAEQEGLPSSPNALAESPGQAEVRSSWDVRGLPLLPIAWSQWLRIRILVPHHIQHLCCLESALFLCFPFPRWDS